MTLCIAAICNNCETVIMASDNLVGMGFVSAELPIQKSQPIHPNWWVLLAGEPANALDIIDWTKQQLKEGEEYTVEYVGEAVLQNYHRKRLAMAENEILKPLGWTLDEFKDKGQEKLSPGIFAGTQNALREYDLKVDLLLCGLGPDRFGHISSIQNPGVMKRHDLPGFYAIGVGMFGALYMMYYRELCTRMSIEECLYYVYEAQYFGYQSGGVGDVTDIVVLQHGTPPLYFDEKGRLTLVNIWSEVVPRTPRRLYRVRRHLDRLGKLSQANDGNSD